MAVEKYNRKWAITYQGRVLIHIYGKKNAYELQMRLSRHLDGLDVKQLNHEDSGIPKRKRGLQDLAPCIHAGTQSKEAVHDN